MKKIKINWGELVSLAIWLYKVVREIIKANGKDYGDLEYIKDKFGVTTADKMRHDVVKKMIMPYIEKKGWDFTGDDIDKIINGVVWFIKKIVKSKNK